MKVIIALVLVLASIFLPPAKTRSLQNMVIAFEDCGSQFELLKLSFSTCSNIPCSVEKGNFVTLTAEFDASNSPYSSSSMKHEAFWIVDSITQSAILFPSSCENSSNCPKATKSGKLEFSSEIFVSNSLPRLSGLLHFRSKNPNNEVLMCYKVPVNIY